MKSSSSPKRPQDRPPQPPTVKEPQSRPEPRRSSSSSSSAASSTTSNQTALNVSKRTLYGLTQQQHEQQLQQPVRSPAMAAGSVNGSNTSLALRPQNEPVQRRASPLAQGPSASSSSDTRGFRSRHHSQGFFEPSLPTASQGSSAAVSASRIAAQAAMQHQTEQHQQQQYHHIRNRSQTIPPPQESGLAARRGARDSPPPIQTNLLRPQMSVPSQMSYQSSTSGGRAAGAATTAANVAFPRTPTPQSALLPTTSNTTTTITGGTAESGGQKEKQKSEKSKMKLFSKPKHIGMSRDKEDKKEKTMPSPSKLASRLVNASTVSLNDPAGGAGAGVGGSGDLNINNSNNGLSANNLSLYSLANSSATTVVPIERHSLDEDRGKEKEKHRHHFLSRQKLKLKDREDFHLPLSSASSNSRPLDPSAPQSLYNFAPSSPAASTFGKSMSGLDLRHGGRALREKKKEEKASAAAAAAAAAAAQAQAQQDAMMREGGDHQADWSGAASVTGSTVTFGGPSSSVSSVQGTGILPGSNTAIQEILQGFGLQNMTPDDAWDFLKAKLLVLFEGEDVRIALEDLNKLVRVHIHCCVQKQVPHQVIEDLRDLLQTGFASLNYSLIKVPEENIIPHLVNVWVFAFGTVLPFIQATFLPLDLEFKGHGSIMNAREAKEFWGAQPGSSDASISAGDALDVRKIVLTSFRDNVILTRYDVLKAAFSRLSLEKMNANINGPPTATIHSATTASASRPSTSAGYETGGGGGSYASQPSSHLNAGSFSSESAIASLTRARAISNTSSNPEHTYPSSYSSFSPSQPSILSQTHSHSTNIPPPPQLPPTDPSQVTETAGRMLQCICVLASVQSDDDAQQKIEELSKSLKHNWLGRGRTGRNRRGFIGTKIRPPPPPRKDTNEQADHQSADDTPRGTDATGW
ncbi:HbrB protein [Nannizzia gypsea CBS 118893]|uniref:HbrB protein n=1 Tax=Arthroderma gypseum (strain ATCC MYA-4604 / CBS 118893) TaxID=535722 RepID=E4UMZ8_ARTGP|nr:HbrB protein [Nannizzia gypsea CBS 118893]EFQ99512.1 HbrB protein [Nannizzia gypsea CBS 118893]